MIEIKREDRCCGCGACANACPKKCIIMVENQDGFRYPQIDKTKCIDCGLCEKACPYLNLSVKGDILKQPEAYFIRSKDEDVLKVSSSGGIFYELAKAVLQKGGVVFGAVWGEKYDEVYHRSISSIKDLHLLQGSKYVQSDSKNCYVETKKLLDEGVLVCYSGTPCQIAGLLTFLKKDYENLLTCDLICHGVPSPVVLRSFIEEKEKKYGKKIKEYYRDKSLGWKPATYRVEFAEGTTQVVESKDNIVSRLFTYYNCDQRNSCYCCRFSRLPRIADISLGDYFVEKDAFDFNGNIVSAQDNMGMSLITVNTTQGEKFFKLIEGVTERTQLQLQTVTAWHLFQGPGSAANPDNRQMLFYLIRKGLSVSKAYDLMYGNPRSLKLYYYKLLRKLGR